MKPGVPAGAADSNAGIAAGAGLVSAARLGGGLLNILLLVLLTRLLDKPSFAVIALVYMLLETITALGTLGLPTALYYYVPRLGPTAERALAAWTALTLAALAAPFALALWLFGPGLAGLLGTPEAATVFGFVAIYVLADFPSQTLPSYLLSRRAYLGFAVVTLVFYGSRFASLAIPAALGASIEAMMASFMLVALLRCAILVWLLTLVEKGPLAKRGFTLRELLGYSIPLSLSNMVSKLGTQLDKYMIITLCSAEVFAVYSVGANEIPLVSSIAYSVSAALVPTLVLLGGQREIGRFLGLWHGSMLKVAAVMMPVFFFFFALAGPLVRLMFTDAYAEATVPFRVFLCLLPLRLCAYGAVVRSLGTTRPVLYSSAATLAVNAALNYPLFLLLGLPGPAVAAVIGQVVGIVWMLAVVRRELGIQWRRVFPFRGVVARFGVAGVAALPLWAVPALVEGDLAQVAVGAVVLLPLYLALALAVGVVTRADLAYLRDLVTMRVIGTSRLRGGDAP